jgi:hypothetical protein
MTHSAPEPFDPYRRWLGITAAEQPADHYRLLGLARFEADADVIESGADRQMAHVQRHKIGAHSAASQQVLNELAAARIVLLNPVKKAAYDQALRARNVAVVAVVAAPVNVAPLRSPAPTATGGEFAFVNESTSASRPTASRSRGTTARRRAARAG